MSNIFFSLVARGTTVLAERSLVSGNAIQIAHRILGKLPTTDTRESYKQEGHMFHVLVANGLTFMCMAEEGFGTRIPYAFLEAVKDNFATAYGVSAISAAAYEYNADFSRVLQQQMEYFSNDSSACEPTPENGTENVTIVNIDTVLEKGEHIELLVNETKARGLAHPYYQPSSYVDHTAVDCCPAMTTMQKIQLVAVIVVVIVFIILIVSGVEFGESSSRHSTHYHHHHTHHYHHYPSKHIG